MVNLSSPDVSIDQVRQIVAWARAHDVDFWVRAHATDTELYIVELYQLEEHQAFELILTRGMQVLNIPGRGLA